MSAYRFFPSFQPETVRPHRVGSVERGFCTAADRPPSPPPPSLPRWSVAYALPGARLLPPPPSLPRWSVASALRLPVLLPRPHRACLGGARLVHYQAPPPSPAPTE